MQLCTFTIHVRGDEAARRLVAQWLRSLPRGQCSNSHTPVYVCLKDALADSPVADEHTRQTYFWTTSDDFFEERADEVVIVGELRDMPPLLFMNEIYRRFPSLTIDGISSLEHELYEHWRFGKESPQGELIEELAIDPQKDRCLRHFLMPGEPSSFSGYTTVPEVRAVETINPSTP